MRTLTILLIAAIIGHQIVLSRINSILLFELSLLALFWLVARPMYKEYMRRKEVSSHLKGITKGYKSKSEPKTWRGKTQMNLYHNG